MIKISLSKLVNSELYTLGIRIRKVLEKFNAEELGISLYVSKVLKALGVFETSVEQHNASADNVAHKDSVRDDFFKALKMYFGIFRYHPDNEKQKKAQKLFDILNRDGSRIYLAGYNTQSASFRKIIKEIDSSYMNDIEALGAGEWYGLFKDSQIGFENTLAEYTAQKADESLIESASDNRKQFEEALRKLFMFLPLHYEMIENEDINNLIRNIQAETDRF
jgi:hypothetical protein